MDAVCASESVWCIDFAAGETWDFTKEKWVYLSVDVLLVLNSRLDAFTHPHAKTHSVSIVYWDATTQLTHLQSMKWRFLSVI